MEFDTESLPRGIPRGMFASPFPLPPPSIIGLYHHSAIIPRIIALFSESVLNGCFILFYFQFCTPTTRDLPNMGQQEKVASPSSPRTSANSTTDTTEEPVKSGVDLPPTPQTTPLEAPPTPAAMRATEKIPSASAPVEKRDEGPNAAVWASSWSQLLWEKWRWGALIVLAVLVSRFSSNT